MNALDTAEFGSDITKLFTDAHEWNSGNHALESEMDFYNNAKGREFGALYNFFTPSNTIKIMVLYQLDGGTLKVLKALNYSGLIILQITTTNGNPGTVSGHADILR